MILHLDSDRLFHNLGRKLQIAYRSKVAVDRLKVCFLEKRVY